MKRHVRVFVDARSRRRTILALGAAGVALLALTWVVHEQVAWLGDPTALRQVVRGFGVLAPVAFVLLAAVQVVVAPVPGQVLGLASGWLFGVFWGTVYSVLGATLGSFFALSLARRYGRPFVERAIDPAMRARFDGFSGDHGYGVYTLFVLVPGVPDDVLCFVAGTTTLDIKRLTVLSGLARIPTFLLLNVAGASFAAARYAEMALVVGALLAVSAAVYLVRDRLVGRVLGGEQ
jgi:uncharacterized membrane protein YdjX (TVP38/TMEM64 family)